jgi:hypothetical protein
MGLKKIGEATDGGYVARNQKRAADLQPDQRWAEAPPVSGD